MLAFLVLIALAESSREAAANSADRTSNVINELLTFSIAFPGLEIAVLAQPPAQIY